MYLFLFSLNVLVLFGDETYGASLADDYESWKQKFFIKFKNDETYISTKMYAVANKKARAVAQGNSVYTHHEKMAAIKIVNLYTQDHPHHKHLQIYTNVNSQLRNAKEQNGNLWLEYAKLLNKGIDILCPNDPSNCEYKKLYRGAKHCSELADCTNIEVQKLPFKGFTSTSTDADVGYRFMLIPDGKRNGYFFYINDAKGLSVEEFSAVPKEKEVLIPANTALKILEILNSSKSDGERKMINERLKAHGVTHLISRVNAKVYVRLGQGLTTMDGPHASGGFIFPNLSIVMVIIVMVKVIF